jgi:Glycosyl hydrolase family 63 C-terminal domain
VASASAILYKCARASVYTVLAYAQGANGVIYAAHNNSLSLCASACAANLDFTYNATLQLAAELHSNLNTLHWSEQHKAYLDVGLHAAEGTVTSEVIVRCQAADGRTVVSTHYNTTTNSN